MLRDIFYIFFGYICGSLLFARIFCAVFKKQNVTLNASDKNPGTANAFRFGGFWCGLLTLAGDLLKGFVPVFLYTDGETTPALILVLASPVIGHILPVFFRFRGGKGIAVTFGVLLGLLPESRLLLLLAAFFILFSTLLRIYPNYYRTLAAYICTEAALFFFIGDVRLKIGFSLIFAAVLLRMLLSREETASFEVKLLWMR